MGRNCELQLRLLSSSLWSLEFIVPASARLRLSSLESFVTCICTCSVKVGGQCRWWRCTTRSRRLPTERRSRSRAMKTSGGRCTTAAQARNTSPSCKCAPSMLAVRKFSPPPSYLLFLLLPLTLCFSYLLPLVSFFHHVTPSVSLLLSRSAFYFLLVPVSPCVSSHLRFAVCTHTVPLNRVLRSQGMHDPESLQL
jgi:hypothetical protein